MSKTKLIRYYILAFCGLVAIFTLFSDVDLLGAFGLQRVPRQTEQSNQAPGESPRSGPQSNGYNEATTTDNEQNQGAVSSRIRMPALTAGDPAKEQENRRKAMQERFDSAEKLSRYPDTSSPITDGGDTLKSDLTPYQSYIPIKDDKKTVGFVKVKMTKTVYLMGEAPTVNAELVDLSGAKISGRLEAALIDEKRQTLARIVLEDNGKNGDAIPGDGIFSGNFSESKSSEFPPGSYSVIVNASEFFGTKVANVSTGFMYSDPKVRVIGGKSDSIQAGSLHIDVQLSVQTKGRFYIEGTLYDQKGTAVGIAHNAEILTPGLNLIGLSFYGLIINELKSDGPYMLKHVNVSLSDQMPLMKTGLIQLNYLTLPYSYRSFTSAPAWNELYLKQMEEVRSELTE